jgi:hypothetical protein
MTEIKRNSENFCTPKSRTILMKMTTTDKDNHRSCPEMAKMGAFETKKARL